jgi:hypothetical protein
VSLVQHGTVAQAICLLKGHDWHRDWSRAFSHGRVRLVCQRCRKQKEATLESWKRKGKAQ